MASSRMKADEKRAKILRQLIALESNKYCFDCSQRGPTYVNMTIGSYVCTQCSGLLRGLNNPHRVKSVNIATFTNEDMEFLKPRGNDMCRKVWLGLYDRNSSVPEPDPKNSQGLKDFLSMKYDNKRWHVAPSEDVYQEARAANQAAFDHVEKGGGRAPRGMIPNNNSSKLIIQQPPRSSGGAGAGPGAPTKTPGAMQKIDAAAFVASSTAAAAAPAVSAPPAPGGSAGRTANLLGDLGADPFAGAGAGASSASAFPADFSAAFSTAPAASSTAPAAWGLAQQPPLFPSAPAQPAAPAQPTQPAPPAPAPVGTGQDKYAALAELDGLFGSGPSGGGGASVFGPPGTAPGQWGASSAAPATAAGPGFGAWSTGGGGGGGGVVAWSAPGPAATGDATPAASIFGGAPAPAGGSVFGAGATPTWSNGNPFGGQAPSKAAPAPAAGAGVGQPGANPFMGNPFAGAGASGAWPGLAQSPAQQPSPSGAQPTHNGWAGVAQQPMMMPPAASHNPFLTLQGQFQSAAGPQPQPPAQPFGSGAPSSTNPFL